MTKLNGWMFVFSLSVLFIVSISAPAQVFTTLVDFNWTDGANPEFISLAQGIDGNLYGTTYDGGPAFYGTAFKVTPSGAMTPLNELVHSEAGLILGADGDLYGTEEEGGANGYGAVFKVTPYGTVTVLHNFNLSDGSYPYSPLVLAADGNFYGTTAYGGSFNSCLLGCGTVFRITPSGAFTTLHYFQFFPDGSRPMAGLVQASNGWLYGTTSNGGDLQCDDPLGCGTVFKITPGGTLDTVHTFQGTDGGQPTAGLTSGIDGKLYGTTQWGGSTLHGIIYQLTLGGQLTTLHTFCTEQNCADGAGTYAGLVQATDGNFYGTALGGGANGTGLIFSITPAGTFTALYSFCGAAGCAGGSYPYGGLTQATSGLLYGTTYGGILTGDCPSEGCGTVYSLDMGLGPFVSFLRSAGKAGQPFGLLGQGFTGSTTVQLGGVPTTFAILSDTLVKATVPVGATTSYVTVTTPGGTLTSNVPFQVVP